MAGTGETATAPGWLRTPEDVNALLPQLWPATVTRGEGGALTAGGLDVRDLAGRFGTPLFVLDEEDLRQRCRAFAAAFVGADVYYAGKAFLAKAVVQVLVEEGLSLDVCTGGELAVALHGGMAPQRIALHGNNKSVGELGRALDAGVGRIVVDSMDEIDLLTGLARSRGVRPSVLIRVTAGVEAHTHTYVATAREDQKFGLALAGGAAAHAAGAIIEAGVLRLAGLHSHVGSQVFDTAAFEIAAQRILALAAAIRDRHGVEPPELNLGGGFGIAYTTQDDPRSPALLAAGLTRIVAQQCRDLGLSTPHLSVEPGRAIVGPAMFTLYEVGTVKHGEARTYVSVDGGMSDNIRAALYGAPYSATMANRASAAPPVLARVVGKHCEAGDVIVPDEYLPADVGPGDLVAVPGTGAYCRSMASNYNHVPRPGVVAVRDGAARVIVRRETEEDLLALDVG